ncbi:hypothetical protein EWM64_g4822 [Hericium alpestre]|uniref:Uncharacterized protein n=1 Tax=Hericium alpestre TaxID=135208 RepID=A0A4Y9ZWD5_9AGAM|nr:hypothetical protein EWM64_g10039 [Hericium alpestre]TFY79196.1 hypothetical protein EWM64_g4822 [Hericium alpestre]
MLKCFVDNTGTAKAEQPDSEAEEVFGNCRRSLTDVVAACLVPDLNNVDHICTDQS